MSEDDLYGLPGLRGRRVTNEVRGASALITKGGYRRESRYNGIFDYVIFGKQLYTSLNYGEEGEGLY